MIDSIRKFLLMAMGNNYEERPEIFLHVTDSQPCAVGRQGYLLAMKATKNSHGVTVKADIQLVSNNVDLDKPSIT